jgi:hypothetical protein
MKSARSTNTPRIDPTIVVVGVGVVRCPIRSCSPGSDMEKLSEEMNAEEDAWDKECVNAFE